MLYTTSMLHYINFLFHNVAMLSVSGGRMGSCIVMVKSLCSLLPQLCSVTWLVLEYIIRHLIQYCTASCWIITTKKVCVPKPCTVWMMKRKQMLHHNYHTNEIALQSKHMKTFHHDWSGCPRGGSLPVIVMRIWCGLWGMGDSDRQGGGGVGVGGVSVAGCGALWNILAIFLDVTPATQQVIISLYKGQGRKYIASTESHS